MAENGRTSEMRQIIQFCNSIISAHFILKLRGLLLRGGHPLEAGVEESDIGQAESKFNSLLRLHSLLPIRMLNGADFTDQIGLRH